MNNKLIFLGEEIDQYQEINIPNCISAIYISDQQKSKHRIFIFKGFFILFNNKFQALCEKAFWFQ